MDLKEAYLTLHKASGLKVGDEVRIVRVPFATDNGQPFFANHGSLKGMRGLVGKQVIITEDKVDNGGRFIIESGLYFNWPFYCLELIKKAEPVIKIGCETVTFTESGIKVGSQEVTIETIDKIHERIHERA